MSRASLFLLRRGRNDSCLWIQIAISSIAIVMAIIGVVMQNDALRYAELGESPESRGMALGGTPGSSYEVGKKYYRDLRTHYRRSSSTLASNANFILLLSVVAGVMAGFTSNILVATLLAALWLVLLTFLYRYVVVHRATIKQRENELESSRVAYNKLEHQDMSKMGKEYADAHAEVAPPFKRVRW